MKYLIPFLFFCQMLNAQIDIGTGVAAFQYFGFQDPNKAFHTGIKLTAGIEMNYDYYNARYFYYPFGSYSIPVQAIPYSGGQSINSSVTAFSTAQDYQLGYIRWFSDPYDETLGFGLSTNLGFVENTVTYKADHNPLEYYSPNYIEGDYDRSRFVYTDVGLNLMYRSEIGNFNANFSVAMVGNIYGIIYINTSNHGYFYRMTVGYSYPFDLGGSD